MSGYFRDNFSAKSHDVPADQKQKKRITGASFVAEIVPAVISKHILIIEDDNILRRSLYIALTKEGFKVTLAENGRLGYEKLERFKKEKTAIDLLVTDIRMPDMSGLDLIQRVYDSAWQIPVFVMSAFGDKNLILRLMRYGVMDYLDKPFKPRDFLERIQQVFTRIENTAKLNDYHILIQNEYKKYEDFLEHDISQYLTATLNYSELALNTPVNAPQDKLKNYLQKIKNSAEKIRVVLEKTRKKEEKLFLNESGDTRIAHDVR